MVSYLQYVEGVEVVDAKSFATYCQQRMGVPYPTVKNMATLKRRSKEVFATYPDATWQTFVRTLDWCMSHHRRFAETYSIVAFVKYAWRDGYLPELDPKVPVDEYLEHQIESILKQETDADWRYRLMASTGVEARRRVYNAWRIERGVAGAS